MKKYHTLLVVTISILFVMLLTWILPITYLNGELIAADRMPAGVFSTLTYSLFTFYNFIYVFLYIIFTGALYGLLNKTSAYRVLLDRIVKHVKTRKVLWLVITVLLIALVVSFTGYTFQMLVLLPFIAAIVLLLGYDKITAAMVTVGSVAVGVIGSTFSNVIVGKLNSMVENVTYTSLVIPKAVLLLVCSIILILNIIHYAKKKSVKEEVEEGFLVPKKVTDKKVKIWPLVTMLIIFAIMMILGSVNWSGAFGIKFFEEALATLKGWPILSRYVVLPVSILIILYNVLSSLIKSKKPAAKASKKDSKFMSKRRLIVTIVFGVLAFLALLKIVLEDVFSATKIMTQALETIKVDGIIKDFTFGKLLGEVAAFGSWSYNDYLMLMVVLAVAIKFTYRVKVADVMESIGEGVKKVLYGAVVVMLTYTVLILVSSHPIGLTILKPILDLTNGLHIITYPICNLFSALFNTDFAYYEYGVLSLNYAASAFTGTGALQLAEFITQTMYGFAMLIAPTSVVLLFTLSLLDVKYTTWLKKMLFVILELLVAIFLAYLVINLWII